MCETLQITVALGFMAFLAWLWFRRVQAQTELQRLHLEGRNRLLERFDTSQALLEFAATEPGRILFTPPNLLPAAGAKPQPEGLRLLQSGLLSLFVGLAFRFTYHLAMEWRAANVRMNEVDAFARALQKWQWSQVFIWAGLALILCGLLSALLARWDRNRSRND